MTDKERILFYISGLAITDVFFRHPEYGKNEIKVTLMIRKRGGCF